jgi:hypothetical protein
MPATVVGGVGDLVEGNVHGSASLLKRIVVVSLILDPE